MTTTEGLTTQHVDDPDRPSFREVVRDIASGSPLRIFFAFILAFAVGSLLIIFTNEDVLDTLGYFFSRPGDFFVYTGFLCSVILVSCCALHFLSPFQSFLLPPNHLDISARLAFMVA